MSRYISALTLVAAILLHCVFTPLCEAMLLAEIGIKIPPALDLSPPAEDSVLYRFGVSSRFPSQVSAEWARQVTSSDVGRTFEASPEMVRSFASALTDSGAEVGIRVNRSDYGSYLDQLQSVGWQIPGDSLTFRKFVTDITKVPVNRLTMTIDSFYFEPIPRPVGRYANIGGGHTIRIYGVPEPMTLNLLAIGLVAFPRRR